MKKHFFTLIALVIIILLITIGTAQASRSQSTGTDASGISSVLPLNRWHTNDLYTNSDAGSFTSIALDPDHGQAAWIAFHNETYGSLWVAHYVGATDGNCGPSLTWFCEQVDQVHAQDKGLYTSIDIYPDTNPSPIFSTWKVGVSYYDASYNALKYAEFRCPLSGCVWTISTIDSSAADGDILGQYTSLKFNSQGVPHIAYHQKIYGTPFSNYSVRHAARVDAGTGNCGATNWHCGAVDSSIFPVGLYPSLDIDWSDNVYIAYYNSLSAALKYAYYGGIGDCGENNEWICQFIDDPVGANVGLFPSLHAPKNTSDYLRVAYYDTTNGRLKYATGPWPSGNCGPANSWSCFYIDNMGAGLLWASVSLSVNSDNQAMIAYTDAEEDQAPLGVKVAGPSSVPPWTTCDGTLPDWQCGRVAHGNGYVDDGQFVALALKDSGMGIVAFSEQENQQPGSYDLKFTMQTLWSFLPQTQK